MPKHVLILGCGRSGTSIFGELFEQLSCYTYHSEPPYAMLKTWDYEQALAVKVPREPLELAPSPGLSIPLSDLLQTVEGPLQIYWQIRHPLDTICSLRVGISRNWGHHPRPPDWQDWLKRPLLEQCAHHWTYINTVGYNHVSDRVVLSRFEHLIDHPLDFARQIAQQVEVDFTKYQGELAAWAGRVQNTNNENFVEAQTSRPYSTTDHTVRVGRWRENLSEEEVGAIFPMIAEPMERFGYSLA